MVTIRNDAHFLFNILGRKKSVKFPWQRCYRKSTVWDRNRENDAEFFYFQSVNERAAHMQ